jgi:hypothetical protein
MRGQYLTILVTGHTIIIITPNGINHNSIIEKKEREETSL